MPEARPYIGIIGHTGIVGGAVHAYFPDAAVVSKTKGSWDRVNKAEIIFVCVPTPYTKKGFDGSALGAINNLAGSKTVIIKSTVPPGTTRKLSWKYPQHRFFFNPEFLTERNSVADFAKPDRQILGVVSQEDSLDGPMLLRYLPYARYSVVVSAEEAELIKYMGNVFLACKVIMANLFYDIATSVPNVQWENVWAAWIADNRIGRSHSSPHHNGGRGAGGACFPKDLKTFRDFARRLSIETPILSDLDTYNDNLLRNSNKQ